VPSCGLVLTEDLLNNSHRVKLCPEHQRALSVECEGRLMRFCQQCTRLHTMDRYDGDKRSCRERLERHKRRRLRKSLASKSGLAYKAPPRAARGGSPKLRSGRPVESNPSTPSDQEKTSSSGGEDTSSGAAGLGQAPRAATPTQLTPRWQGETVVERDNANSFHKVQSSAHHAATVMHPGGDVSKLSARDPHEDVCMISAHDTSAANGNGNACGCNILPTDVAIPNPGPPQSSSAQHDMLPADIMGKGTTSWPIIPPDLIASVCEPMVMTQSEGGGDMFLLGLNNGMTAALDWPSRKAPRRSTASLEDSWMGLPDATADTFRSLRGTKCSRSPEPRTYRRSDTAMDDSYLSAFFASQYLPNKPAFPADQMFAARCLETSDLSDRSFTQDVSWLSSAEKTGYEKQMHVAHTNAIATSHAYAVSFKLFGLTPAELSPHLQHHLLSMLQVVPDMVDGAIQPGCIQLSVDFWLDSRADYQTALKGFSEGLLVDVPPSWLRNADVTMPNCSVSVRNGVAVVTSKLGAPTLHVLEVDAPVTAMDEGRLVLAGAHAMNEIHVECRLNGYFQRLDVYEAALDEAGNTVLLVSLPVHDTGLAWLEVYVHKAGQDKPLKGAVPMVFTDFPEMADEVSPLLRKLWRQRKHSQVLGFLKDIFIVECPAASVDASQVTRSCACLMVRAARNGWVETLLRGAERSEDNGCLEEALTHAMPGPHPLLCHAVMCGQEETAANVLDLLDSAGLLQSASQWETPDHYSALSFAKLHPHSQLESLLARQCPESVLAAIQPAAAATPTPQWSCSTVSSPGTSAWGGRETTMIGGDNCDPSEATSPETAGALADVEPLPLWHRLAHWLSLPLVMLATAVMLCVLLWMEGIDTSHPSELVKLCALAWLALVMVFPHTHFHVVVPAFERVYKRAAMQGLALTGGMTFADREVEMMYGRWVVKDVGCTWWEKIEYMVHWTPTVMFALNFFKAGKVGQALTPLAVSCLTSWQRRRFIHDGNLEGMQWMNVLTAITHMCSHCLQIWVTGDVPISLFVCLPGVSLLRTTATRFLVLAFLQFPMDLGPMNRMAAVTRFFTVAYLCVSVIEKSVIAPLDTSTAAWLHVLTTESFHWCAYYALRTMVEEHRITRFLEHLAHKSK